MDTQANNSLIKVEEFNQIMQSAPATLQRNQTSVSTCNQAGQTLLDTIEAEGGISSDELDGLRVFGKDENNNRKHEQAS